MPSKEQRARSVTISAPVAGLNTRLPLDAMSPYNAITLKNLFPEESRVTLRRGSTSYATGVGSTQVSSLIRHVSAAGVETMLAASPTKLYDVSASGAATELLASLTNGLWQSIAFRGVTLLFNGADQPQQWSGSALSNATYTGIADDSVLVQGTTFRSRLHLVQINSTKSWYGAVNAITGALTEFDYGSEFTRGGYLLFLTTWTRQTEQGVSYTLVVMSSEGEALLYQGPSPDIDSWTIVGRVFFPKPLGRRAFRAIYNDVEILTAEGMRSIAREFARIQNPLLIQSPFYAIDPTIQGAVVRYSGSQGWEITEHPAGRMTIVNVPVVEYSQSEQLVRNSLTDAWALFTNWNAVCFCVYNDLLYFGGIDGNVYQADVGSDDSGARISWELKTAYSYPVSDKINSHFQMIRPLIAADNAMAYTHGIAVDFQETELTGSIQTDALPGSAWDADDWDVADWGVDSQYIYDWHAVDGIGRAVAIRMKGESSGLNFSVSGFQLQFTPGGIL